MDNVFLSLLLFAALLDFGRCTHRTVSNVFLLQIAAIIRTALVQLFGSLSFRMKNKGRSYMIHQLIILSRIRGLLRNYVVISWY